MYECKSSAFAYSFKKMALLQNKNKISYHTFERISNSLLARNKFTETHTKSSEMTFLNNWGWLCIFTSISINSVWHQWQFTTTVAIEQHLQTYLESFTVSNEIIREQPGQMYLDVKMCFMSSIILKVNIYFFWSSGG